MKTGMTSQRDANIAAGIYAHNLADAGVADRDRFAKECLTREGAAIYHAIPRGASDREVFRLVAEAVDFRDE